MKRKIVTLLFVCCLGISVAACGNETTDTKEYGEASDNELTIDEDDSEDEDYAETLGNSSSVSSSTSQADIKVIRAVAQIVQTIIHRKKLMDMIQVIHIIRLMIQMVTDN